jgi:hypothetical protein
VPEPFLSADRSALLIWHHTSALDAIHIASAISLDAGLAAVATYDLRMQEALAGLGVDVIAPA